MTNEEAIEVLAQDLPCEIDEDLVEAMAMAIKALEQQPCEDCISRHDALNCVTGNEVRYRMVNDIRALPSVTPKEKTGKWETTTTTFCGRTFEVIECSYCKQKQEFYSKTNYCPNCGARMVSE